MKKLSLGELGELEEALKAVFIKKIEVPKNITIPDWPTVADKATLRLGKKEYLFPAVSRITGLVRMEKRNHNIEFVVYKNGAFGFAFMAGGRLCRSDSLDSVQRLQALFIFHQFKKEICEKLATAIRDDTEAHNEAALEVESALATFLPYLIADALALEE